MLTVVGGLSLALFALPVSSRLHGQLRGRDLPPGRHRLERDLIKWVVTLVLIGYVLVIEGRPVGSLSGARLQPLDFVGIAFAGTALLLAASVVTTPVLDRFGLSGDGIDEGLASFAPLSMPRRIGVALTAGVTEEVIYRGYLVERLIELTGSGLLAGGVSVAAFVGTHTGSWSADAMARMVVPAVLLTAIYLWTRSLPAVIAIHALNDAVGLALAGRFVDEGTG